VVARIGWIAVAVLALGLVAERAYAQTRKPTAKEVAAIRDCAKKNADDPFEAERRCVFALVAAPCTETRAGQSNLGMADCHRVEQAIWDDLLNENFRSLREDLDDDQKAKLRDMQRAWIAYRDSTCGFYADAIQGSLAVPMSAACAARETARRALLLKQFSGF
jgi:uncharacterized protein YecT (DUF1311 family)